MCAVYRVFNLSGKRSCGPGQCLPATAGSAQGLINIDKEIYLRTVLPETKVFFRILPRATGIQQWCTDYETS